MSIKKKLEICLNGNVDDYASFLDPEVYKEFLEFNNGIQFRKWRLKHDCEVFCYVYRNLNNKEFAEKVKELIDSSLHGAYFAIRNGKNFEKIARVLILDGVI